MPKPPPQNEYLSEIRAAVKGLTTAEERDYLWAVVESIYRPATSYHRWKMVAPTMEPQHMRVFDVLYRRIGHNVHQDALIPAVRSTLDFETSHNAPKNLRRLINKLRHIIAEYDLPFIIHAFDRGYCLIQIGDWTPPYDSFDKT